jgi:hypothetical protein
LVAQIVEKLRINWTELLGKSPHQRVTKPADLTPIRKPVNREAIGGLNYFPVTGESTAIPVAGAVFCNLLCGKIVQKVHV